MNHFQYKGDELHVEDVSRPRVAEVMEKGDRFEVIREREPVEDLIRGERTAFFL